MSLAQEPASLQIHAERPQDAAAVERLILAAFGPGRFAKAAERLREGRAPLLPLSFVGWDGTQAVGCVRQWAVAAGGAPAILLGPLAVDARFRSQGLGAALVEQACSAASDAGFGAVVLVGDEPYYAALGFAAAPQLELPGPVDRRRILTRVLKPGAGERLAGRLEAA